MSAIKKAESEKDREIVVTRLIDAPVERVWRAWTDNAEIVRWWGPHGFTDESEHREFRPGGHWRHYMIGPDGTRFLNYATYKEIEPMKRIVLLNGGAKEDDAKGMSFRSEITFKAVGKKTELTMRSVMATAEMRERVVKEFRAIEGGQQTLAKLDAFVSGKFHMSRLVDAPRERVWRAWTDAKELPRWMGPQGSQTVHSDLDFRVGGSYHYALKFAGAEMWGLTHYKEIVKPEKIVYVQQFSDKDRGLATHPLAPTWPKRMLATILFQDFGPKTLISLYWEALEPTPAERETFEQGMAGMNQGWAGTFDRLDALLEEA